MALDDYFVQPDVQCLTRLFDAVNAMDISRAPRLSRDEMLIMRATERKDVFAEKFFGTELHTDVAPKDGRVLGLNGLKSAAASVDAFDTDPATTARSRKSSLTSDSTHSHSPPTSLGIKHGESNEDLTTKFNGESAPRTSLDRTSVSSSAYPGSRIGSSSVGHGSTTPVAKRIINSRDTHFYTSFVRYTKMKDSGGNHLDLPVNWPLSIFPEEVGDVSCKHKPFICDLTSSSSVPSLNYSTRFLIRIPFLVLSLHIYILKVLKHILWWCSSTHS